MGLTVSGSTEAAWSFAKDYNALKAQVLNGSVAWMRIANNTCDVTGTPHLKDLDSRTSDNLARAFGQSAWGYFNFIDRQGLGLVDGIVQRAIETAAASKPAHVKAPISTVFERQSYLRSPAAQRDILNGLLAHHPHLKDFKESDAKAFTSGNTAQRAAVIGRFPAMDEATLVILANALQGRTAQTLTALTTADDTPAYKNWLGGKQQEIIAAMRSNTELMQDIAGIKYPQNIDSAADVAEQINRKERIAKTMAGIFAKVYGLTTLGPDDIHVVFSSAQEIKNNLGAVGVTHTVAPGYINDEKIILRENPAYPLLTGCDLPVSDRDAARQFIHRVSEELQHATDDIIADKLMRGQMQAGDVSLHHSTLFLLNGAYFSVTAGIYENQFRERTAKLTAEGIMNAIDTALDQNPPTATRAVVPANVALPPKK